ncbi:unnamed protein product [Parnassius mnemosyne]|uniref:Structure-specific endonuclease subunit SLX4 n=1 Tax=Parnassius mnemosyne TaxID=213953 RepID=A0AAV1L6K1_9NEOP
MTKQIIKSKYFESPVMDESLTDFKETKNQYTGPKRCQKFKVDNKKAKPRKHIKGQKDIRALIKSKKNCIVTFTKDFNNVCLKSGIDVDSEQLQLAIALSKSLQSTGDQTDAESSQTKLTSQERTNKIRRTLQEYGFKVPEIKFKPETSKRLKRCIKQYKLLLTSEEERQQRIFDKYSQVLFQNIDYSFDNDKYENNIINSGLYYLTTNIKYELMKSNEIFYVPGLLHDISYVKSDLLRDWSKIPGRPASPKLKQDLVVSISDLECTQTELDTILSGSLKAAKDIYKFKIIHSNLLKEEEKKGYSKDFIINQNLDKSVITVNRTSKQVETQIECNKTTMLSSPQRGRSLSPDIFEDETSSIIDNSIIYTGNGDENIREDDANQDVVVDLTQPVDIISQSNITKPCSQLSQSSNRTKRKTNDYMDLTDCISVSLRKLETYLFSQALKVPEIEQIQNDCMEITECVNPISQDHNILDSENIAPAQVLKVPEIKQIQNDCMEMTECVNPISQDHNSLDSENIALTQKIEDYTHVETMKHCKENKKNVITMDLTQSSNSDEDLPIVDIGSSQAKSSDVTIIIQYDDYNSIIPTSSKCKNLKPSHDLTKEGNVIYVEEINEESTLDNNSKNKLNNSLIDSYEYDQNKQNSDIDLTQSSDSSVEVSQKSFNTCNASENHKHNEYLNLGKKDNVSIDYDEICIDAPWKEKCLDGQFDDIHTKYANISDNETESCKNQMASSKSDLISNCSNNSEPFNLSDKELNYSMHKSKIEHFDMGGISIIDEICNINKTKNDTNLKKNCSLNRSLSESCLPNICIKDNKIKTTEAYITLSQSTSSTPIKAIIKDNNITVQTPTNSEYVVKVGDVTPMLDYAAMSSPERNKELEKYGLKPFKRKRAIQLLTHLYNQTHPLIEHCSEQPVAPKKLKLDSPKKALNLQEKHKSPKKTKDISASTNFNMKNYIYKETKDLPDIKDIGCSAEDWVFQKREKTKVHACRVPLHIAFHNYVSCRRGLREAILRYEPVNIDVIHKDLVSYGYRYNPKELLKFLDKKCITVKTADNNARNSKK